MRKTIQFGFEEMPSRAAASVGISGSLDTFSELARPSHDDLVAFLMVYLQDEQFARRFAACIDMLRRKNADYTQGQQRGDRIAAFRRISNDIGIPMEKVWAIFTQKHWGAVMRYVKDGTVESEPIDGRINDIINYMVLLGSIIADGRDDADSE